jgi:hypothetical protein
VEVWTRRGLQRFIVLFFIELSTRKVGIAGIAVAGKRVVDEPDIGRDLSDPVDGILTGKRYLIHDRDPLFTTEFLHMLADVGVEVCQAAATITEPECVHREVRCGRSRNPVWSRSSYLERRLRTAIHNFVGTPPPRAQSPGFGEPIT